MTDVALTEPTERQIYATMQRGQQREMFIGDREALNQQIKKKGTAEGIRQKAQQKKMQEKAKLTSRES